MEENANKWYGGVWQPRGGEPVLKTPPATTNQDL